MLGRQKQRDYEAKTGQPLPPGHSSRPDVYRTDNPGAPASPLPAGEIHRRAPDVTAVTGRRTDIAPSAFSDAESKRLTVGRGITLSGEIRACDLLIVEGQVEATLSESRAIEISTSGVFKGVADIESAEVSGLIEGELVVRNTLIIHATGRVLGKISYGRIEIARGGIISGQIDVLPESPTTRAESESLSALSRSPSDLSIPEPSGR
ncbi:MAG TPA: polymer-forming cytoskeletal protein [Dongiaceae bacterium]|jgi:cytoskeletal protein CcmA (bactofilin family)|nr:polymer-forming cytoskeletal protein [Dongiaceae bacterium]